jgi:hypothetical protein
MSEIGKAPSSGGSGLTREKILDALGELDRALAERGIMGEICLFGGAVMVLAFNARLSTKDIDAVFQPASVIRDLASRIAEACHLPDGWLNDGVKGFLSRRHDVLVGNLPQFSNLRLTMPTPAYLLAMKCMASRIGAGAGDADDTADIVFLVRHLELKTAAAVLEIVGSYYPPGQVPIRAKFLVESLFEEGRL